LPISLLVAVPVAVTCVAETRVVFSAVAPNITVAPLAKWAPLITKENAPTAITFGVTDETCGTGLSRVTASLALMAGFAVSAALTVTLFGVSGNSGAVYNPPALIVPVAALPPATPFTDHVTAGEVPSDACAVNCCVAVPCTVAPCGLTFSWGGGGLLPECIAVQPQHSSAVTPRMPSGMRFTDSLPHAHQRDTRQDAKRPSVAIFNPGE
jgi:hypothetical protein